MRKSAALVILGVVLIVSAPSASATVRSCAATRADVVGPYYKPDAPVRSKVGSGHVLQGTVRAAPTCAPIPGARIEFWLTGAGGRYTDDLRATVLADAQGRYRFESSFPVRYADAQPHIHIKVSAKGYRTVVTRYFPQARQHGGAFDLVLVRAK